MEYKGYTVKEDYRNPYGKPEFIYFPSSEGEQHDADYINDSYVYCGNCKWADTAEEAFEMIDELLTETI